MTKDEMQAEITRLQYEVDAIQAIKAERDALAAAGKLALEAMELALPSINPKAIDGKRLQAEPIADCYVNTTVKKAIESLRQAGVQ